MGGGWGGVAKVTPPQQESETTWLDLDFGFLSYTQLFMWSRLSLLLLIPLLHGKKNLI